MREGLADSLSPRVAPLKHSFPRLFRNVEGTQQDNQDFFPVALAREIQRKICEKKKKKKNCRKHRKRRRKKEGGRERERKSTREREFIPSQKNCKENTRPHSSTCAFKGCGERRW